jgi:hemerythrin superfamily protein
MPSKSRKSASTLDAIALLKADHRKVEGLFAQFEKATGADRKMALAEQVCLELTVHAKIEEDIFYPACRDEIDDDLWHEALVEHDGAKVLIHEIETSSPEDDFFDAKMKVLSEMVKHHVNEEEKKRGNMFAQAKKAGIDTKALGLRLAEEKKRLTAEYKEKGLPTPPTSSYAGYPPRVIEQ